MGADLRREGCSAERGDRGSIRNSGRRKSSALCVTFRLRCRQGSRRLLTRPIAPGGVVTRRQRGQPRGGGESDLRQWGRQRPRGARAGAAQRLSTQANNGTYQMTSSNRVSNGATQRAVYDLRGSTTRRHDRFKTLANAHPLSMPSTYPPATTPQRGVVTLQVKKARVTVSSFWTPRATTAPNTTSSSSKARPRMINPDGCDVCGDEDGSGRCRPGFPQEVFEPADRVGSHDSLLRKRSNRVVIMSESVQID